MFHFGSNNFHLLTTPDKSGENISFLKTTELPLSHADANAGTLQLGKMVDYKAADETEMRLGSAFAVGILSRSINATGTTDATGFRNLALGGYPDMAVKRGLPVGIFCPFPGVEAIFEGAGDTGGNMIDHLVIKTGTGAISGGTTDLTELSVINGAWRAAQSGDFVLALFRQSLTPKTAGNIRIRLRFVAPYKKP